MSSRIISTVFPIQRVMARANASAWEDGVVAEATGNTLVIADLDGAITKLRVVGPAVGLVAGEPVAYHPVAEILHIGHAQLTARVTAASA